MLTISDLRTRTISPIILSSSIQKAVSVSLSMLPETIDPSFNIILYIIAFSPLNAGRSIDRPCFYYNFYAVAPSCDIRLAYWIKVISSIRSFLHACNAFSKLIFSPALIHAVRSFWISSPPIRSLPCCLR